MNDVAVIDDEIDTDREVAVRRPEQPVVYQSRMIMWAQEASAVHRIALSLCKTSFVAPTLRSKPEEVAAIILAGNEVGFQPIASLRTIDIIQGTPALRAIAMRALVQSHGHHVRVEVTDDKRAVVVGRRKGESVEQRCEWTIEMARQRGLTGKDNWKRLTAEMLVARATSVVCRWIASDVLLGLPYSAEELSDELGDSSANVELSERPVKRARRKSAESRVDSGDDEGSQDVQDVEVLAEPELES